MTDTLWVIEEFSPDFKSRRPREDESRVEAHRDQAIVAYAIEMEATQRSLNRTVWQRGDPAPCPHPAKYIVSDAPSDRAVWVVGSAAPGFWEDAHSSEHTAMHCAKSKEFSPVTRYVPEEQNGNA